jgi:hypothetical protein
MAMIPVSNKDPLIPRGDYSPVVRDRINRLKQDADRLFSLGKIRKRCQQALVQFYTNLKPEPYADFRIQLSNNREYRFAQSLTLTYRSTNDRLIQWAKGCMHEYLLQEAIEERERRIEDFARMKIASRWYQMKDDDEAWRVFSQNIPYDDAEREGEIKEFFETLDILSILTDVINGHDEEYGLNVDYEHVAESSEASIAVPDQVVDAIHELADVVKESLKKPRNEFNVYPQTGSTANLGCQMQSPEFKVIPPSKEQQPALESNKTKNGE